MLNYTTQSKNYELQLAVKNKQSKKEQWQYYTPKDVAVVMSKWFQNLEGENICDVRYTLKNLIVKPNNVEEHSIYVEAEVEISCEVYENKDVDLIEDLYSPSVNLNSDYKKIITMQEKRKMQDVCNIRQKQDISELKNEKIYDSDVIVNIQKQNIVNGRVVFEGEIEINFIFSSNRTGGVDSKKITIPFEHSTEVQGISKNSKINVTVEVANQDFVIMTDENIDIKIDLNFVIDTVNNVEINVINSM